MMVWMPSKVLFCLSINCYLKYLNCIIVLQQKKCINISKICRSKNFSGVGISSEIQALALKVLACSSTSEQWVTALTSHVKPQSFQCLPHSVNLVTTPAT